MPAPKQHPTPEQASQLRALADLARRRDALDRIIAQSAADVRASGVTWTAIGTALGVSPQAAQQRYGG